MRGLILSICLVLTGGLYAQIIAPSEFLPHNLGETFTPHHLLVDYYQEIAEASPRVKLEQYGLTNEDRPLLLAFVSTPENIAKLEAIRENNLRGAGLLPGETDPALDDMAIVWLSYSVHGNEAGGSEASMGVLYDLVKKDARIGNWLKNTVVIIDPSVNPDGYNRYSNWYRQNATLGLDPNPAVREHQEPWPGGRVNHYLFDLNRDWAWQTQVESPSYGDTWPTFNGSIGMTYEQAGHGRSGRAIDLPTGDTLTLADRVAHHRTTSLSTIEIASKESDRLTQNFRDYFKQAVTKPQGKYGTYIVSAETPRGKMKHLLQLLDRNGIEYGYANEGFSGSLYNYRTGKDESGGGINVGDLVISAFQPRSVLTQVLFDPEAAVEDSVTYDITGWSVPLAYGLDAYASTQRIGIKTTPGSAADYDEFEDPFEKLDLSAAYAYVVPWEDLSSAAFLGELVASGVNARTATGEFRFGTKTFAPGSIVINKGDNRKTEDLTGTIRRLVNKHKVGVQVLNTGFSTSGGDLGSSVYTLQRAPRIAVLAGENVNPNQFGQVWYYFEQDLKYPVSVFDANDIGSIADGDYDIVIMPSGSYNLGGAADALKGWVRDGGKLVAIEQPRGHLRCRNGRYLSAQLRHRRLLPQPENRLRYLRLPRKWSERWSYPHRSVHFRLRWLKG